jgi:hypothetical protein
LGLKVLVLGFGDEALGRGAALAGSCLLGCEVGVFFLFFFFFFCITLEPTVE